MRWALTPLLILVLVLGALAGVAEAQIERYAVIIGNNEGAADEIRLRYAESDADKIYDVLRGLGGFRPERMLLLKGEDAATVKRALISMNSRIRGRRDRQTMVFVYYSGHADAKALHLGDSELDITELEQLVRGSPADFRLLVLDSCRSGAITRKKGRRKGGRKGPAYAIRVDERLASEGMVFLTSSAADEDAQESDQLKGSFFTHYLVSGLVGAADRNSDGRISLDEAYRHAYDSTLRASSRTLHGIQHPTFRYDLHGQGDIVLTWLDRRSRRRAVVALPKGRAYLLLRGGADGPVVAEVGARDRQRQLSVRPGPYFIRGRGRDYLVEGMIRVSAGQRLAVSDSMLRRIEYARLVRKGGGVLESVHGPRAGYWLRTALANSADSCFGPFAGYAVELANISIFPRFGACRSSFDNDFLSAQVDSLDLEVRISHAWDVPLLTIEPGLSLGGALFRQRFTTLGQAPARTSASGQVGASIGVIIDLAAGWHLLGDAGAYTYFFRQRESDEGSAAIEPSFAIRASLALGKRL
ncbi:MAG: caspase family protein [Myxococcota bacterium]